jgi:hypothetical protein
VLALETNVLALPSISPIARRSLTFYTYTRQFAAHQHMQVRLADTIVMSILQPNSGISFKRDCLSSPGSFGTCDFQALANFCAQFMRGNDDGKQLPQCA